MAQRWITTEISTHGLVKSPDNWSWVAISTYKLPKCKTVSSEETTFHDADKDVVVLVIKVLQICCGEQTFMFTGAGVLL